VGGKRRRQQPAAPYRPRSADCRCPGSRQRVPGYRVERRRRNRLDIFKRRGEPIPAGWALKNGEPTTDANAANDRHLAPVGDYKGSGMAILMSMITSFLPAAFDDVRGQQRHHQSLSPPDVAQLSIPRSSYPRPRVCASVSNATRRAPASSASSPAASKTPMRATTKDGVPLEQFTLDELMSSTRVSRPVLAAARGR
jgi:LDH2 family malate/lactate/ureidoglycolate dehydrogenase